MPARPARLVVLAVAIASATACERPAPVTTPMAAPATTKPEPVADLPDLFPDLDGFATAGEPQIYSAKTLFDYVNGAAPMYLTYGFEELGAAEYERADDVGEGAITIDIYRHSSANNGYGIYSRQRLRDGKPLAIGAEASYQRGALLFVQGRYMVKLTGYGLGQEDEATLTSAARRISTRIGGAASPPEVLGCLPGEGMIPGTARYIAESFLDHGFLHWAFAADYGDADARRPAFIIEAPDDASAATMVERWTGHARSKGESVAERGGGLRFVDPYYRAWGAISMRRDGRYVWGLFDADGDRQNERLGAIGRCLRAKGLVR